MTSALIALFLLAVPSPGPQQAARKTFVVSGRVIDGNTGKPLAGAAVVLWRRSEERASGRRVSAPTGVFEIPTVERGQYVLAAEVPGGRFSYRTETIDVDVIDRDVTDLGLVISPVGPRPVLVSATLAMEGNGRIPASLSRIQIGNITTSPDASGTFQVQLRADEKYRIRFDGVSEGLYIKTVSAGSWNPADETLSFETTPPSSLRIVLATGRLSLRGRVLDTKRSPAGSQVSLVVSGPAPASSSRSVEVKADGTFEVKQLRSGTYQLVAKLGSGQQTRYARFPVTMGSADRSGVEVVLQGMTRQNGRVIVQGAARLEDLRRFRPMIEVTDVHGVTRLPIGPDGTFAFDSFEGEYSVAIRDVPPGYDTSVVVTGSSVEVFLTVVQGDDFPILIRPQPR